MAEIEGGSPVAELVAALVAARAARVLAGAPGPTAAVFSGAIGAGKTTTIRLVAQALAARGFSVATVPERLPAHLFAKYLADPAAHAWLFQAAMAHLRAHDAYDAFEQDVDFLLFERYIGEDGVFFDANVASGTIDLAAHPEYAAEYAAITGSAETYFRARCALFVNVHTTFELACARMSRRDRPGERDAYTDNPYFRTVFDMREAWIAAQADAWGGRVVTFDNRAHSPLHVSACEITGN